MKTTAEPGSVSCATLRTEDLLDSFLYYLATLDCKRSAELTAERERIEREFALDPDDCEEQLTMLLNEEVWEAMESHSPEGHYFGANEGDGADFGYWEVED